MFSFCPCHSSSIRRVVKLPWLSSLNPWRYILPRSRLWNGFFLICARRLSSPKCARPPPKLPKPFWNWLITKTLRFSGIGSCIYWVFWVPLTKRRSDLDPNQIVEATENRRSGLLARKSMLGSTSFKKRMEGRRDSSSRADEGIWTHAAVAAPSKNKDYHLREHLRAHTIIPAPLPKGQCPDPRRRARPCFNVHARDDASDVAWGTLPRPQATRTPMFQRVLPKNMASKSFMNI